MNESNAAVLMPDNEEELKNTTLAVASIVESVVVTDQTSFVFASSVLKEVQDQKKKIKAWFAPLVEAAFAAHKKIKGRENETLAPVEKMEAELKGKLQIFLTAQELKRQEEERKARLAAEEIARKERERLEIAALNAMDKGKDEKAEALIEQAEAVFAAPVVVEKTVEQNIKLEGGGSVSQRKDIEVILPSSPDDIKRLCAAISAGQVPVTAVSFSKAVLKSWAKQNVITGKHHGCIFRETINANVRA